jgi:uncharacterized protein
VNQVMVEIGDYVMIVATAEVKLYATWVNTLKDKRMVVQSLIAKVQNKFHVSVAEVADNDIHQTIVLGIACVAGDVAQGDSILDHVLNFIEDNTEAEITNVQREVR